MVASQIAATLGGRVRRARKKRQLSLNQLAARVGLTPARVSQLERGEGTGSALEVWVSIGIALDIPFKAEFWRDRKEDADDAGHLSIQDLALRLARETGRARSFELQTKPSPGHSVDVCSRDDTLRLLVIQECWNSFGNINASVRSTNRKVAEASELAVALGGDAGAYDVRACWIVRDTRRNREILGRYPDVFASAFPGSSRQWVGALTTPNVEPPHEHGLVWCDSRATRLFSWRR